MGFIGGLFGGDTGNEGDAGMNYQAGAYQPYQAFTPGQIQDAYKNAQSGLSQQQSFIDALQKQNGIQNQSDVYNQFNAIAQGTGGPNPAQAMLNQATGANTANQAALMASQRGAGANTGLIARQAAQQGGALQQNAASQAAVMRAQQSQNALNSMGGIAGQQVGQLAGGIQNYNQAAQNEQSQLLNAVHGYNAVQQASMASQNAANASIAKETAAGQNKMFGSVTDALSGSSAMGMLGGGSSGSGGASAMGGMASGGIVKRYADGGEISNNPMPEQAPAAAPSVNEPVSWAGKFLNNYSNPQSNSTQVEGAQYPIDSSSSETQKMLDAKDSKKSSGGGGGSGLAMLALLAKGGEVKVPTMVSPGEIYLSPSKAKEVAKKGAPALKDGEVIPGKAKYSGDTLKNDVVPKNLDVGGIVVPRTKAEDDKKAEAFVLAILAKHGHKIPGKK